MKKRILSLMLAALLCAPAFAGCSNNSADPAADDNSAVEANTAQTPAADAVEEVEEELSPLEQRARIPDNLPESDFAGRCYEKNSEYGQNYAGSFEGG